MNTGKHISFIGAGNVAWHLAQHLAKCYSIKQICANGIANAKALGDKVKAEAISSLANLDIHVDLIIIAAPDDAIAAIAGQIPEDYTGIIAHTSGSVDITSLAGHHNFGVFYPLQTFSKHKELYLDSVPFFIEGNNSQTEHSLLEMAKRLSNDVQLYNSAQRLQLHKAAVIACNFSNYMWQWAEETVGSSNIFKKLQPLIEESVTKAIEKGPKLAQTGPAKRGDQNTIEKHLNSFDDAHQKELYHLISTLIQQQNG